MNPKHKTLAEEQFKAYPELQAIHISSDDQVFHQANYNDGVNHQRRLDEKVKLVTIFRKDLAEKASEADENKTPDESWKKEEIAEWLKLAGKEVDPKASKLALLKLVSEVLKEEEEEEDETGQE